MRWLWQEDPRQVPPQGDLDVDQYDVDHVDVFVNNGKKIHDKFLIQEKALCIFRRKKLDALKRFKLLTS